MKNIRKISLVGVLILSLAAPLAFVGVAYASTPSLSLTTGSDGDSVNVNVTGDAGSGVLFYYTKTNVGSEISSLGTTDGNGSLSTTISTSGYGIASGSSVYVTTNGISGPRSNSVVWPSVSTAGNFSLSQTGLVLAVGQSSTITAFNSGSSSLYLQNNSNPPVANVNISGSQITINGLAYGSAVVNICMQSNTTSCASVYVTVGNSSTQQLAFSISNVTIAPGQSVPVTISGGTGTYTVLNNSNSGVIQASINGSVITLTTNSTSGTSAITVCSSDMSSCGIINASAGSASSSPLYFSQQNPNLSIGQSLVVSVSGGSGTTYYLSNNSNTTAISTNLNAGNLTLTGNATGSANITVCSSSGSCGTITVSVGYTSAGGALQLSQSSMSLLVGQVLSVTVSGGISPYTLSNNSGSIFQASLSGNIVTLSGISTGSGLMNVCSSGGACVSLSVTVNSSGVGTPISFSQNNISLNIGGSTAVSITGAGGYYVSSSSNQGVASVQISGSTATISGLAAGNSNISICQSGGQCAILFVTAGSNIANSSAPVFSQTNPNLAVGQSAVVSVSGGSSGTYYISANSNPGAVQTSLNGSSLTLTGLVNGVAVISICASSSTCSNLTATVGSSSAAPVSILTTSLPAAVLNQPYSYALGATGGSGNYTFSTVSGSLPPGLTLAGSGLISGTPTSAGSYNMSVTVTDSLGNTSTSSLSLAVSSPTAPVASSGTYSSGQLINENGTIYIVYQDTKVGFTNAQAFLGLGFVFNNVSPVTNSGLALSDKVVVTASGAHPRGTWILSGSTVFFVTPSGLIPVPDWSTFLNNGGQATFIVKANSYDLKLSKITIMGLNDTRVK